MKDLAIQVCSEPGTDGARRNRLREYLQHAVLQRPYAKGRDYYDLMFYLNRWRQTGPNVAYLVNALQQTGYEGEAVTADNWRRVVAARVEAVDWPGVVADVDPFLLREADATALRKDRLLQLLGE